MKKLFSRIIVVSAMVALLATTISATPALAAKGGQPGGTTGGGAALSFWQNGVQVTSVRVNSAFEVRCSGASGTVYIGIIGYFNAQPISASSCSLPYAGLALPGTYTFELFTVDRRGNVISLDTEPLSAY